MSFFCPSDKSRMYVTETRNTRRGVRRQYTCRQCGRKEVTLGVLMCSIGVGRHIANPDRKTVAAIREHVAEINKRLSELS